MSYNIVFLLYPGFEELDLAGPHEVFATARQIVRNDWRLLTASAETVVRSSHGLSLVVDHLLDDAPSPRVLVVPGGRTQAAIEDERYVSHVRDVAGEAELLTSVCTGALMYWAAGLLEGRRRRPSSARSTICATSGASGWSMTSVGFMTARL